jgi:hypothetical protein
MISEAEMRAAPHRFSRDSGMLPVGFKTKP